MFSPFAMLRKLGISRGLLGGSRAWTAVGVTMWTLHLLRRMMSRQEEVVSVEKLKPGQTVVVRALERPPRRRR